MAERPRMTPEQRIRAAQDAYRRANSQPGLPAKLRQELRRTANNLVACNMMEAKRNQENPTPTSAMSDRQYLVLPQNNMPLNRLAYHWLMKARAQGKAQPHYLHLLSLAAWGLENGAQGEWPAGNRYALQDQVNLLFGWKAKDVLGWLTENPDGPESDEQEANLLNEIKTANSPEQAAARLLSTIYSRQVSACPMLQPAASELS